METMPFTRIATAAWMIFALLSLPAPLSAETDRLCRRYEEAGTCPGRVFIESAAAAKATVHIPTGAGGKEIHIILEVRDQNSIASLHGYRRVVIDLENRIIELDSVESSQGRFLK
jgi:hypothetical protein